MCHTCVAWSIEHLSGRDIPKLIAAGKLTARMKNGRENCGFWRQTMRSSVFEFLQDVRNQECTVFRRALEIEMSCFPNQKQLNKTIFSSPPGLHGMCSCSDTCITVRTKQGISLKHNMHFPDTLIQMFLFNFSLPWPPIPSSNRIFEKQAHEC